MFSLFKKYAKFIFEKKWTMEENDVFMSLIKPKKDIRIVDLGCGDGRLTLKFADKAKAKEVIGVESGKIRKKIKKDKIKIISGNLNHKLSLKDNYFDLAISHFSLEHLYNVDVFMLEVNRMLKKGGVFLVATDNLASWPNLLALFMGWQPFSSAYGVASRPLGNPFAVGGDFVVEDGDSLGELSHNKVLAYKTLLDVFSEYGFRVEVVYGIGYFPFFGKLSELMCRIDKRHSHLLIVKGIKK